MLGVLKPSLSLLLRLSDRGRARAVTHSDSLCKTLYLVCKSNKPLIIINNKSTNVRNFPLAVRNFPLTVRNFLCHPQLDYPSFPPNVRTPLTSQLQEVPHI